MVTHDVGLKAFADKVVWMRDGLVQRVETVPPMQRQEALSKLNEELARDPSAQTQVQTATEVRSPHDYEPIAFQLRQLHTRRSLITLGLVTPHPDPSPVAAAATAAAVGEAVAQGEAAAVAAVQEARSGKSPRKQHRHHKHRHRASSSGRDDAGPRVYPAEEGPMEATELVIP